MKYVRIWRFRFTLWRLHRRIGKQLGVRRWRGFTNEELDVLMREAKRIRAENTK